MAHILLVDDDEQFRAMLVQMLKQDSHQVTHAGDGEEALRAVASERPDLIITDILMPRKDGIETIIELARAQSDIPVIAISGGRRTITAVFNLESASLLGVAATLAKPFTRGELRDAIARALG